MKRVLERLILSGGRLAPLVPVQVAFLSGVSGTLGAALSAELVAVAKDAEHPVLEPTTKQPLLEGGDARRARLSAER
jgi:hypothetical protein